MLYLYYLKIDGQMLNVVLNLLQKYVLHPSPPCSVTRRLTCTLYLLNQAWVWPVKGTSSQSKDGRKERRWYLFPWLPLCQMQVSNGYMSIYTHSSGLVLWPGLSATTLSQDSSNHSFPFPMQVSYRLPWCLVSLIYLNSAHILQIAHSLTEPNYQSGVCHSFLSIA